MKMRVGVAWTAIRPRTRFLYSLLIRIAVLGARSAPSRHCQPAKGEAPQASGGQARTLGWFLVGLALAGGPARAHHSHSMFDTSQEITVTGTVTNYSYRNPHVFLYLDVKDEKGEVVPWAVEMSNITNMQRRGIQRSTFKAGDMVTVKLNPLKDGRPGGNYTSVIAADGKTYE